MTDKQINDDDLLVLRCKLGALLEALNSRDREVRLNNMTNASAMVQEAIDTFAQLSARQGEPVGVVIMDGIGEQQSTVIKWTTDYKPKKDDLIYTSPPSQCEPVKDALSVGDILEYLKQRENTVLCDGNTAAIKLFSDGSGSIVDTTYDIELAQFNNIKELKALSALINASPPSQSQPTQEANQLEIQRLRDALNGLLERYVDLVNCGDCGKWNPETEDVVVQARQALAPTKETI